MSLLRSKELKAFADVIQFRVCQLGRDGCDRLFRDSAERRTRERSRKGHIGHGDSRGRVGHFHVSRSAGKCDVDQRRLVLCGVLVLGVLDCISRVVRTTRGPSTAATGSTLDATSNFGLGVCKSGGRRGVFLIGSASKVGDLKDHDDEVVMELTWTSDEATSDWALIKQEWVGSSKIVTWRA